MYTSPRILVLKLCTHLPIPIHTKKKIKYVTQAEEFDKFTFRICWKDAQGLWYEF